MIANRRGGSCHELCKSRLGRARVYNVRDVEYNIMDDGRFPDRKVREKLNDLCA